MTIHLHLKERTALAALAFAGCVGFAHAHDLDGDWCSADGRRFSIKGAEVVTAQGMRIKGTYDGKAFSYAVPSSESTPGAQVTVTLEDKATVRVLATIGSSKTTESWKRCAVSG